MLSTWILWSRVFRLTRLVTVGLMTIFSLSPTYTAQAAGIVVTSFTDSGDTNLASATCDNGFDGCSLRAAIQQANALPGPDTITLPNGTYILTLGPAGDNAANSGDLDITGDLTIAGGAAENTLIEIDPSLADQVFDIAPGSARARVQISGVTIRNGRGGITVGSGGVLNLQNSVVTGHTDSGISNRGVASLSNVTIIDNTSATRAGGITNSGTLTITDSLINTNTGANGGILNEAGASLTIAGGSVNGNTATSDGGGILNHGTLTIAGGSVNGNTATSDGGGIANRGALTLHGAAINNNIARHARGGGIFNAAELTSTARIELCWNIAGAGGGLFNAAGARATIDHAEIDDNAADEGAGIVNAGTLALSSANVMANSARLGAGGIRLSAGSAILSGVTIGANAAVTTDGGGMSVAASATLVNVTISGNSAGRNGGGIFIESGTLNLGNVTIAGNVADGDRNGSGDGGGVQQAGGSLTARNTLLAGNADRGGQAHDCAGTLTSQGYNLIQSLAGCTIAGNASGNLIGQNPRLAELSNNGGATRTHALLPGSPAIDAGAPTGCTNAQGAPLTSDQRGQARPTDGNLDGGVRCDIGAYEFAPRRLYLPAIRGGSAP